MAEADSNLAEGHPGARATAPASPRRRVWVYGAIAASVIGLGWGAGRLAGRWATRVDEAKAAGGAALLGVTLPSIDGTEQPLAQWRGKVLVANFWATWCAPCREEMPALAAAQKANASNGLQIVGIGIDDAGKMRQFAMEAGVGYPLLVGGYGALELSRTFGNTAMALPFTVVVDRRGEVVMRKLGPLVDADFQAIIAQLR